MFARPVKIVVLSLFVLNLTKLQKLEANPNSYSTADFWGAVGIDRSAFLTIMRLPDNTYAVNRWSRDGDLDMQFGDQGSFILSMRWPYRLELLQVIVDETGQTWLLARRRTIPFLTPPQQPVNDRLNAGKLNDWLVFLLDQNGQPKTNFGDKGMALVHHSYNLLDHPLGLKVLDDGRFFVYGDQFAAITGDLEQDVLMRQMLIKSFHADGSLDTSFGRDGILNATQPLKKLSVNLGGQYIGDIALDKDGVKILYLDPDGPMPNTAKLFVAAIDDKRPSQAATITTEALLIGRQFHEREDIRFIKFGDQDASFASIISFVQTQPITLKSRVAFDTEIKQVTIVRQSPLRGIIFSNFWTFPPDRWISHNNRRSTETLFMWRMEDDALQRVILNHKGRVMDDITFKDFFRMPLAKIVGPCRLLRRN